MGISLMDDCCISEVLKLCQWDVRAPQVHNSWKLPEILSEFVYKEVIALIIIDNNNRCVTHSYITSSGLSCWHSLLISFLLSATAESRDAWRQGGGSDSDLIKVELETTHRQLWQRMIEINNVGVIIRRQQQQQLRLLLVDIMLAVTDFSTSTLEFRLAHNSNNVRKIGALYLLFRPSYQSSFWSLSHPPSTVYLLFACFETWELACWFVFYWLAGFVLVILICFYILASPSHCYHLSIFFAVLFWCIGFLHSWQAVLLGSIVWCIVS